MIKVNNLCKSFDGELALSNLDLNVQKGSIYGLIGTNGAGKTTIIKHLAGILKADEGELLIDGVSPDDNEALKMRIGLIPDDLFFFNNYTLKGMGRFYSKVYKDWNGERFEHMISLFKLNPSKRIRSFSKGMKKQAAFSLVMSTMPDYLVLDEPIDGLDPIVRKMVWRFIVDDVAEREMTVLVSSHNLKEMEGICDYIGVISKGKMVLERDLDDLKSDMHKVQVAFKNGQGDLSGLNVLHEEKRGSLELLIIKDKREKVEEIIEAQEPLVFDLLPLSLEEIFIYELGGESDEINEIIF